MNHEIELKFKINSFSEFESRANSLGIHFGPQKRQIDKVFLLKNSSFKDLEAGNPVLRIRETECALSSTAKRYVEGVSNRLEATINIDSSAELIEYFSVLGFVEVVCVDKKRSEVNYLGSTITMDDVKGLGHFAEIEIISSALSAEQAKQRVLEIAEKLSLSSRDIVNQPYDAMIFELN